MQLKYTKLLYTIYSQKEEEKKQESFYLRLSVHGYSVYENVDISTQK